jgi:hypothetical protein
MSTVTPFQPSPIGLPFNFQATLLGATSFVTSTGTAFTVTVPWNTFGQRFYVLITDENNEVVLNTPLIGSPTGYPISMIAGYFTSTLVYDEMSRSFVVTP